jgi:hypothetical protein
VLELGKVAFWTLAVLFRVTDSIEDLAEVELEPDLLPKHDRPLHSNSERFSLGESGDKIGSLDVE